MTAQSQPNSSAVRRRRPRVYRTVLGIALAALLAAWLPFSILYVNALTNHALVVASKSGPVLRTTASGAAQPAQSAQTAIPVTTRTS
jgi:hypothetical protein